MTDCCPTPDRRLELTAGRTLWADELLDDGVYVLTRDDFEDPDHIQVELVCRSCRKARLLTDDEWEVA